MSNIRIDKSKALKKWGPVLENMGVSGTDRLDWMSEYAEFHSINENAYVNAANAGMGAVTSPQPSTYAGTTNLYNQAASAFGSAGSGDLGQNLLPVAMKIAAQTIGLDLVAVKPSPGPKLDLLYIDFQYDDVDTNQGAPLVFKFQAASTSTDASIAAAIRAFTNYSANITETVGGFRTTLSSGLSYRVYTTISSDGSTNLGSAGTVSTSAFSGTKTGVVEFLGFSRIDGLPIFRAFRQANALGNFNNTNPYAAPYQWDVAQNTFGPTTSFATQCSQVAGVSSTSVSIT